MRKTTEDYRDLAHQNNLLWKGDFLPQNTGMKTLWECSQGHIWGTSYGNIRAGWGCPYCCGTARKIESDYIQLGLSRNIAWLGPFPENTKAKTRWKCANNHVWDATYNNIYKGSDCPICSNCYPKTERDYRNLAKERNIKWRGAKLPKDNKEKTLWECEKGHQWWSRFNNIQQGQSCPHCQNKINGMTVSKPQIKLSKIIGGEINYPLENYFLDVAFPEKKIAIEYNGWYWHAHKQQEDWERSKQILDQGWKLMVVKSGNLVPDELTLKSFIKALDYNPYIELILDDWEKGPTRYANTNQS